MKFDEALAKAENARKHLGRNMRRKIQNEGPRSYTEYEEIKSEPKKSPITKPHSPEWFQQLVDRGDNKSLQLSALVARHAQDQKSNNFCSMCGDKPSKEMKLNGKEYILTVRLCDDCHVIRIFYHQELFEPLKPQEYKQNSEANLKP